MTLDHRDFTLDDLAEVKRSRRATVSVCIPARNEATTLGTVLDGVVPLMKTRWPLVDELIVANDHSQDDTVLIALARGAKVVHVDQCWFSRGPGKGTAMKAALESTSGDLVVFLDADVHNFSANFVLGLVGPLLTEPNVKLVKPIYERDLNGIPGEGGRVTELTAKPLIRNLFPDLSWVHQPLAGECAGPAHVFSEIFQSAVVGGPWEGYGIEMEILIETSLRYGPGSISQVYLGERRHRNRTLAELSVIADQVAQVILSKTSLIQPGQ